MIKLESDQLRFTFPQINETLLRLVEGHVQATLPCMLTEDRQPALEQLRAKAHHQDDKKP